MFNHLRGSKFAILTIAGIGVICATSASSNAGVLYNSGGFEPPRFVDNADLTGQDAAVSTWLRTADAYDTAFVRPFASPTNTQGVLVSRAAGNPQVGFGFFAPNVPFSPTPALPVVDVSWDEEFLGAGPGVSAPTDNAFFGIDAYNGGSVIATAGFDTTTGKLVVRNSSLAAVQSNAFTANANTFYHFALDMNLITDQYTISINGSPVFASPFVQAASAFTSADIATFGTVASLTTVNEFTYFDNYVVSSQAVSAVPLPGEAVLLGVLLPVVGLFSGRRFLMLSNHAPASIV